MDNDTGMILPIPDEYADFKVVQLLLNGRPFLCLGNSISFHRSILREFLRKNNIAFSTIKKSRYDIPEPKGENYEVVGMGRLLTEINEGGKEARFFGDSQDYGMPINEEHVEFVKKRNPDWTIKMY